MKVARPKNAVLCMSAVAMLLSGCAQSAQTIGVPATGLPPAQADGMGRPLRDLHNFSGGNDGSVATSGVIQQSGKLYGVASQGGSGSSGVVYESTTNGKLRVVYAFPANGAAAFPDGGLLFRHGKLYGTTGYLDGSVYSVTPSGTFAMVHQFAGADGSTPQGGLIDVHGTIYGTTTAGGAHGDGVVFAIDPSGTERTLYDFGATANDASSPVSRLTWWNGKLYGTTSSGGAYGGGTVYSLTLTGSEAVLYSFGNGTDGNDPFCSGVTPFRGKLYGTTRSGGTHGKGVVFAISPSGSGGAIYNFGQHSDDGTNPMSGVIVYRGALYGPAWQGGHNNEGAIFRITASGAERTLYSFHGVTDGSEPFGRLLAIGDQLYGTAPAGGANGDGTLYRFTP
jgi:uncharacterized repeat protein (TIGR03803 family)